MKIKWTNAPYFFDNAAHLSYNKIKQCDIVYPAGNNLYTEKVEVVVTMAGFVMIRFPERKDGTHVCESRLYSAKDEAEASIKKWNIFIRVSENPRTLSALI